MKNQLFFRIAPHNGGVVFAAPERAKYVARIHSAINNSTTWGEFRAAMPREEYSDIVRWYDEEGEPRPKSEDPFSGEAVPGWTDGDYPPWLQTEMESQLPRALLEQFGTCEISAINGNFWMIPEENLDAICAALKSLDWDLVRADDLLFW